MIPGHELLQLSVPLSLVGEQRLLLSAQLLVPHRINDSTRLDRGEGVASSVRSVRLDWGL